MCTFSPRPTGTLSATSRPLRLCLAVALFSAGALAVCTAGCNSATHAQAGRQVDEAAAESPGLIVKLAGVKLQTANIHFAPCEVREMIERRTVPGRVNYDEAKHLEIKSPAAGVVKKVLVAHRQRVQQGDCLAILSSREIGLARDELAQATAELEIARREADWAAQIEKNLTELLAAFDQRPEPADVAQKFADKVLDEYRDTVLAAYSKLVLADAVLNQIGSLENGAISGRTVQERKSNREIAAAAFKTACEQSKFAASQASSKCRAAVQHAQRMVAISCQQLEALGGSCSELPSADVAALSDLCVRPPFDGVVQNRRIVDAAQVATGQPLFVLADTRTLWISAEVHERDWNALQFAAEHDLEVQAPGLPRDKATARVKFTEGAISPESGSVTLVGELDNSEDLFRPGMFAWVSAAVAPPRSALAVPPGAIMRHEQAVFVFVAEGPDTFRRADVTTGLESPEWVEVTSGLAAGQQVVDQGAFFLKSELLLERETE